jgi:hypothetical protein
VTRHRAPVVGSIQKREPHDRYYREREILRGHWDAALCGKPFRMITAMQALGWCHQNSIGHLLIARDMGCELFTSRLHASRFASLVRFCQSYKPGIQAHIQPHYGTAIHLLTQYGWFEWR